MELSTLWFILIAVLWGGYFVLEGFDFGVGALFPILGRSRSGGQLDGDTRRRVMLSAIGPVWDGNEVWLITAGGAMFAAFPHWYATLFSGFYMPLFLVLIALIVRALGIDYRGKGETARWRRGWDYCIFWGSALPALLWGIIFTNIVRGVPIDGNKEFVGTIADLLNLPALLGGLTLLALFLTHGAFFLGLKTDGEIRTETRKVALRTGPISAVLAIAWLAIVLGERGNAIAWVLASLAALALVAALAWAVKGFEGKAFIGTMATIALAVAALFVALFPAVMPSSIDPAFDLTTANASSSHYTLTIMSWVAAFFVPLVLAYTAFTYWTFRKRVSGHHIPVVPAASVQGAEQ